MTKKVAIVVQRYGIEINGGAEYHARLIAEKLSKYVDIEVFTSTAIDYVTWEHHYNKSSELINGIKINRYNVAKKREPEVFGKIQKKIYDEEHSLDDELQWLEEEGPFLPDMISDIKEREDEFEHIIFFSFRYYHSYYGVKTFMNKSILVPTAEHDEVLYLRLFKDFFNLPKAIIYNSVEKKKIIEKIMNNVNVLSDIVGVGSEIPENFYPDSFRDKFNIGGKYFVYIGRLDENKGVPQVLDYYLRLLQEKEVDFTLVLMGKSVIKIPEHKNIKYIGFVTDQEKFNGLYGAEFLIIPSQYESLSMVSLEAWALGKPVVANGKTEVLQGQCKRSNAGLWYENYSEFKEIILLLLKNEKLKNKMGANGIEFFKKNYSWSVIENKYLNIFKKLEKK
jgi:glycosyltransferase involved in cell wall biosynthesis